jgi:hypothetical protein
MTPTASDSASKYDPIPFMVLSWDPANPVTSRGDANPPLKQDTSDNSPARANFALPPHPSDPRSMFNSKPDVAPVGATQQPSSPTKHHLEIHAEELWVYSGSVGYETRFVAGLIAD